MSKSLTYISLIAWLILFGGCKFIQPDAAANETRVSPAAANAAEPAIAADSQGNLYVLYVEHAANKAADVYLQKFGVDFQPAGERVRINPEAGRATAWRGDPPTVKIGTNNAIYVGWTARVETANGSANDLYLSVSRDGGKTFAAPVKVNDDSVPAVHGMHSLEVDKNGRIYFAWLDERYLKNGAPPQQMPMDMSQSANSGGEMKHSHGEPNREVYFAVSTDDGKSFSANKKIAGNVCPCCKTSMTVAPDGRLYVSWRQVLEGDFRHIAVASSLDGGSSFSPPVIVSDDRWQIASCPVSGAPMWVNAENTLQIAWFTAGDAGTPGLYFAESKDGGKSFSPRLLISAKGTVGTPVLLPNAAGKLQIIFSATDGNTHLLTAQNNLDNFAEQTQIDAAGLPDAAVSKNKTAIVFIKKINDKGNIFLFAQS